LTTEVVVGGGVGGGGCGCGGGGVVAVVVVAVIRTTDGLRLPSPEEGEPGASVKKQSAGQPQNHGIKVSLPST
jgi:hypothetical protein